MGGRIKFHIIGYLYEMKHHRTLPRPPLPCPTPPHPTQIVPFPVLTLVCILQARRAISAGDYALAAQLGAQARKLANYAIAIGVTLITVIIVVRVALNFAFA